MNFLTILYFILTFFLLGKATTSIFNIKIKDIFENIVMTFGFGLAIFPILSIILNTLHIPLHFLVILSIPIIYFIVKIIVKGIPRNYFNQTNKIKKIETIFFIIIILFTTIHLIVYNIGSNKYNYLEDDDPYKHAEGTKYVSLEKTYSVNFPFTTYLEPYPPTYDVLMGVLHQTNNELQETLKLFNNIIISLSMLFMFYFVRKLTKKNMAALISTILLIVIPCYLSHFIWAQSYALSMFPIGLYLLTGIKQKRTFKYTIKKQKKQLMLFALVSASIFVIQPSAAAIYLLFTGAYIIAESISFRKIQTVMILALIFGLLISQIYWIPTKSKFSNTDTNTETINSLERVQTFLEGGKLDLRFGQQTHTYKYREFRVAEKTSKMDQPTGIGTFMFYALLLSILFLLGVIIKNKASTTNELFAIILLIFTFMGVEGNKFPINLIPHRFWAFFAIAVVLAIGLAGSEFIYSKKIKIPIKLLVIVVLLIGIIVTSAYPKYVVETSMWPPGVAKWSSNEQLAGYIYLKNHYQNMKVFPVCGDDKIPISFNQLSYSWDKEVRTFRTNIKNKTTNEITQFLKQKNYDYYIISSNCVDPNNKYYLGVNKTNEILSSAKQIVFKNKGFFLVKI